MVNPTIRPASPFNPTEDAEALKQAFKGFGTDEKKVIEILAKRSNEQRQEIAKRFKTMYGKDLIDELKSELRGNFEDLVVALMYPTVDYYAKQIHKAISGVGTDEDALIEILGVHTNDEIKNIREAYETKYGPLEDDIKSDTSGTLKRLFVSLITACRDESGITDTEKAHQDAQTLLRAGELFAGTDESAFNQILCQRNREQLKLIFADYQNITGHEFEEAIENEFSGTTKRVLIALVKVKQLTNVTIFIYFFNSFKIRQIRK
ncbi:annexin B9-like [Agrilus planipennis]|uniref:Annexin n=1 Tax=Agrilus planipennis TaxID=224129 RepID=A0A1W4XQT8_AGRPL|nr:annexin B9-like [Agrilus planipennis]